MINPLPIRFVSSNKYKLQEASHILAPADVVIIPLSSKIEEIQTDDFDKLVKDKALKAFRLIGRPLFVEHTGLSLAYLNGQPGGLTQLFWDALGADKFADIFGKTSDPSVTAKTVIGYTDSRKLFLFSGSVEGTIASVPRGRRDFQWDCVFIPNGFDKTFAEMGERKNDISMRRIALQKFQAFLRDKAG